MPHTQNFIATVLKADCKEVEDEKSHFFGCSKVRTGQLSSELDIQFTACTLSIRGFINTVLALL
jgi:hypothetical protein